VVGQEHITEALARALKKGLISHAYLFTGPRGVGKTSIARILAHEINGLKYEDEHEHLDIIEIDAASNRRIDEIRDLREKVHIAPAAGKYKVYIIDEVHMLTREAFNALLKTLEEPPAHVVFILATTEAHKLPETIVSRTQRFAFKPIGRDRAATHLKAIAKAEGIDAEDSALDLIAEHGEGAFRDSISLLDQMRGGNEHITLQNVQDFLGLAPAQTIEDLLQAMAAHDAPGLIATLQASYLTGRQPAQISRQLGSKLRTQLIESSARLPKDLLLKLLADLVDVPASADPKSKLEISLLDIALSGEPNKTQKTVPAKVEAKTEVEVEPAPKRAKKQATLDERSWQQVLEKVKGKHNTLYGVLRSAHPIFEPGRITLECAYTFHQKKLNDKASQKILSQVVSEVTGDSPEFNAVVKAGSAKEPSKQPSSETVKNVSNIFGGAELLES
jgi:DNA polymerase-3 subunit gamma/tau